MLLYDAKRHIKLAWIMKTTSSSPAANLKAGMVCTYGSDFIFEQTAHPGFWMAACKTVRSGQPFLKLMIGGNLDVKASLGLTADQADGIA